MNITQYNLDTINNSPVIRFTLDNVEFIEWLNTNFEGDRYTLETTDSQLNTLDNFDYNIEEVQDALFDILEANDEFKIN